MLGELYTMSGSFQYRVFIVEGKGDGKGVGVVFCI